MNWAIWLPHLCALWCAERQLCLYLTRVMQSDIWIIVTRDGKLLYDSQKNCWNRCENCILKLVKCTIFQEILLVNVTLLTCIFFMFVAVNEHVLFLYLPTLYAHCMFVTSHCIFATLYTCSHSYMFQHQFFAIFRESISVLLTWMHSGSMEAGGSEWLSFF
jgi:hypothetical protein